MGLQFVELNPDSDCDFVELRRQRVLCGWAAGEVDTWRTHAQNGDMHIFWFADEKETFDLASNLGHFSLDWIDKAKDSEMANKNTKTITFTGLYVLPQGKGQGIGSAALAAAESIAKSRFDAQIFTLTSVPSRFSRDPDFWVKRNLPDFSKDPVLGDTESWYLRKGYSEMKQVDRLVDGQPLTLLCMSKAL